MIRLTTALLLATLSASLSAEDRGVIRGIVVEASTNKPLARATVVLEPMPGTPGATKTARADRLGQFSFEYLHSGYYVLRASRRGYMSAEFGQKRWNSAGQPIALGEDEGFYAPLRLHYYGAISGTVLDENDIGLPGHEVAVFRAVQPPEYMKSAPADDRGVYRLSGLDPGRYFIRTVAKQYEEGGYLPTFSRETIRPEQALIADVLLENQIDRVDVRPLPGRLFQLRVGVAPEYPDTVLTLASGMGRTTVQASGHTFTGLPPGEYEIYAESESEGLGAHQRVSLAGDSGANLIWATGSKVAVRNAPAKDVKLRYRRRDLAGPGPVKTAPASDAVIFPGRWELLIDPPDGYYPAAFFPSPQTRLDGWIDVTVRSRLTPSLTLSTGAAGLHGTVKDSPFAPVYLEAYDPVSRKRVGELRAVRADSRGQYRFGNLAPGTYRLLSTFEYLNPSAEVIDTSAAITFNVRENSDETKDLDLWGIR